MQIILFLQIIISIGLTVAIIMQSQSAGGGLGSAFGGGQSYHTKRGLEKGLFYLTIFLVALFTLISIVALI